MRLLTYTLVLYGVVIAASIEHENYDHVAYEVIEQDTSTDVGELFDVTTTAAIMSSSNVLLKNTTAAAITTTTAITTTQAAIILPLKTTTVLDYAIYQNLTIIGIENMGPVRVFCDALPLGVPSFTTDTVYTPFPGVTIFVPAGAWLTSERRGGKRDLTITVFEIPAHLHPGGFDVAGPGVDLGPHDQRLQMPVSVLLPLYQHLDRVSTHALDAVTLAWTLPQSSVNRSISVLGTYVATSPLNVIDPSHDMLYHQTIVIACTIAGIFLLLLCLLIFVRYRHRPLVIVPFSNIHATVAFDGPSI